MTAAAQPLPAVPPAPSPVRRLREAAPGAVRVAWGTSTGLVVLTALAAVVLVVSAVGFVVDGRTVLGVSTWNKPAKFAISFLLFAPTLLAIYARVPRGRVLRTALEIVGWSMVLELSLITFQSARAVRSHFNQGTALDAGVWAGMASGVGVFTVVAFVAGVLLLRRRLASPATTLAVQLAVPLMTLGAILGYLMVGPKAGQDPSGPIVGGHTVGGVDGSAGLPLLGWSTEHGDERVAHFVGLHAAQVVPLVGLAIAALVARGTLVLTAAAQRRLVALAAAGYAGIVATVAVQAGRGQSVVHPDAWTVAGLAVAVLLPGLLAVPDLTRGVRAAR